MSASVEARNDADMLNAQPGTRTVEDLLAESREYKR